MSYVPLMGEVHGFLSGLPWKIILKLRQSNCLLQDGCREKWVAPCKVLRGWNELAPILLPEALLNEHLGLGLLHKDIDLPDTLARALGVEDYGPKTLVQFLSSLGRKKDGVKSMGLGWLFSFLNELHGMIHSYALNTRTAGLEEDLFSSLKKVPFIPLSNGTYGSLDEGTIWLPADYESAGVDSKLGNEAFPWLYSTLRIVSSSLFSEASGDVTLFNNCSRMLRKIGVQQMSAHELIRIHILPSISDCRWTDEDHQLLTEYFTFVMLHLESICVDCHVEREHIILELHNKAPILTNYGFKRPFEVPIHFSGEFGSSVDLNKLLNGLDYEWYEVDKIYLKHPLFKSMSGVAIKWREFLQKLGVADFVKVVVAEKSIPDLSPTVLKQIMCDSFVLSPGLVFKDWESPELVHILSLMSKDGSQERCKYLLDVLDALWDDYFSDKVLGYCTSNSDVTFKSSLLHCISDIRWIVSSVDDELHYPRELFYDCDAVRSILGYHAPYAVPKIKSSKLLKDIGFKTQVTLDDALATLQTWRFAKPPFTASLSQMSKLYTFIWKAMSTSRQQVVDALSAGAYIFVPNDAVKYHEDVVAGMLLSPGDVYWHDRIGAMDLGNSADVSVSATSKTLCSIYPSLHDFFVNECGVNEGPSFHHYIQMLQQLSRNSLPSQAANVVFQVLLKWADGLKSHTLCPGDLTHLKECLAQLEFTVLPAIQDKWVSLHPSFGLICWCDDDNLKKEFKHSDNIDFLYFGELTDTEKEMLQAKLSLFLKELGVPSLSEVVTREAIYYGLVDSDLMRSMVEWALPFAQRYIYNLHPERYSQLKLSGFSSLHDLKVVVVEQLFYRNAIQKCDCASKKRFECSSLLQGKILYTTQESDFHSLFMELSRLFFNGNPELHLANFLHMITTMTQSGSTEEQMELFVLNSQKLEKLPSDESVWSLSSPLLLPENDEVFKGRALSTDELISSKAKKKAAFSSWPPADWRTAPGFSCGRRNNTWTPAVTPEQSDNLETEYDVSGGMIQEKAKVSVTEIKDDLVIEDDGVIDPASSVFPPFGNQIDHLYNLPQPNMEALADPANIDFEYLCPEEGPSKSSGKDQLHSKKPGSQQAMQTGRDGELVAFKFFGERNGAAAVNWVNQDKETGLPYDIVIGADGENKEFIEVKASRYARKDWFEISTREWQFAAEKGDSFSVAHVIISGQDLARIIVYKNPVKLCQQGKLQLVVMTPRSYQEPHQ